ncbi:MAG: peptidoglycan-associated lipoprotein [Bdellovibrionales bacterium CG10_big_fil_rev_8_21_14_0_10_45_34]|nr:MAG: peptidoglycan-associated lipoprotein [Bdellovibrionales bacterium CG10_big_fil_rev_8_21_14_0_10_45_34]
MIRTLVTLVLAASFIVSCSKKKKDEGEDGDVASQAMNFEAAGSDSGKIDGLHTVNFDYDTADLSSDAKSKLSQNADWIKARAAVTVQIEGHCDERGSIEYNLALGERRAKAAKAYLVSLGVPAKQMTIISYGEEKPLVMGDSDSDFAKNRRANFVPLSTN